MQYVKECLLLYWSYFKPFTLKQHVRDICPEITNSYEDNINNIYRRSAAAKANLRLQRYDEQGWWLTALVPIIAVFLYVPLAETAARLLSYSLHFNWLKSSLALLGWLTGQLIIRAIRRKLGEDTVLLVGIVAMILMPASAFLPKHLIADSLLRDAAFGVAAGVGFGVVFGMAGSMAGGVAFSVAAGGVLGVAVGMMVSGAADRAFGMALGVAVFGVAFGASLVFGVLRIYFWLPELLWTLCLKLAPVPPASRLRFLPPQFDQLIILPLPFLPGFIAEAYQENQAAARQTISYLISSTNQQKTAGKAMLLIAAESFSRCGSAKEIAEVRAQLDWLPAELAGKITACLELSQDTAAALEASSPYRQEERLKQVCGKLVRLRNGLADASAREATALGSVLDHWLRLLETEQRVLREAARRSEEIPQVYLPGPPLEPDKAGSLFKGRRDLYRQIDSLILSAQPPTLVLHGGRRSGKSSAICPSRCPRTSCPCSWTASIWLMFSP
jgi:uncharacterized protein